MKIKILTRMAILTAASLILGYFDSLIPLFPSLPGVKLGLSNLVLLYAVFYMSPVQAILLMLLKVGLSNLLFGSAVSALYSIAGGVLSLTVMLLLHRIPKVSVIPVSTFGGILHMIGQILIGCLLLSPRPMLVYAPWLLLAGLVTGILLGVAARAAFYGIDRYERRKGA